MTKEKNVDEHTLQTQNVAIVTCPLIVGLVHHCANMYSRTSVEHVSSPHALYHITLLLLNPIHVRSVALQALQTALGFLGVGAQHQAYVLWPISPPRVDAPRLMM